MEKAITIVEGCRLIEPQGLDRTEFQKGYSHAINEILDTLQKPTEDEFSCCEHEIKENL